MQIYLNEQISFAFALKKFKHAMSLFSRFFLVP